MAADVLLGPWAAAGLPMTFYASVNGGNSAWSVHAKTLKEAAGNAACDLHRSITREVYTAAQLRVDYADCPFELDAACDAEIERRYSAELAKLHLYEPAAWNDHCIAIYRTRKNAPPLPAVGGVA
jgi:hypothetical protein